MIVSSAAEEDGTCSRRAQSKLLMLHKLKGPTIQEPP